MKIDIGEVVSQTWQITWKNKILWVFGMIFGLFFSILMPIAFMPTFLPVLIRDADRGFTSVFMGVVFAIIALVFLAMFPISVMTQTSITVGVVKLDQEQERLPLVEMFKRGLPFFWRVLGLLLLFFVAMMLFNLVLQALIFLLAILTFGLGTLCAIPLLMLMYPVIFLVTLWMEQSMNGIVIDGMTVVEAIKHGWNLIRQNLFPVGLMAIVVYVGVGMISSVAVIPMMSPAFLFPFIYLNGELNWIIVLIGLAAQLIFIPLTALFFGWSFAFTKSAWVLTYLRLTRSSETKQPELLEAAS